MKCPESQPDISLSRRIGSSLVLLALLIQIMLFFVGLMVPVRRAASLWGKDLEERRGVVWQAGQALKSIAERFPVNSRIYLLYPQPPLQYSIVYYFYPRDVSVTMTNGSYGTLEDYAHWHEIPSWQWLQTNRFDFVLSFKNGGRAWKVEPGLDLNADSQ
jgi:hypothetical protein